MEKSEHFNKAEVYCTEEVFLLLNISKDGLHCLLEFFFSHLADNSLMLWPANLKHKPNILQGEIILCLQVPPGVGSSTIPLGRHGRNRQPLLLALTCISCN